ncbi:attacin 2, partial [Rhyzopertha dominica]
QSVDISKSGQGTRVTVGHGGNLLDNRLHRLDASGFASKQFHPSGPLTVGGNLDYTHKPSGAGLGLGAQHTHRFGTDLSATGKVNLYRGNGGRTTLDANAQYNRHFGGPFGTGKPNYGGNVIFTHRF